MRTEWDPAEFERARLIRRNGFIFVVAALAGLGGLTAFFGVAGPTCGSGPGSFAGVCIDTATGGETSQDGQYMLKFFATILLFVLVVSFYYPLLQPSTIRGMFGLKDDGSPRTLAAKWRVRRAVLFFSVETLLSCVLVVYAFMYLAGLPYGVPSFVGLPSNVPLEQFAEGNTTVNVLLAVLLGIMLAHIAWWAITLERYRKRKEKNQIAP